MFTKKFITKVCVLLAGAGFAFTTYANDLKITNQSDKDSTAAINGGACSSKVLGKDGGVTRPGETKTIKAFVVKLACGFKNDCYADVYASDNCSDNNTQPKIGAVY